MSDSTTKSRSSRTRAGGQENTSKKQSAAPPSGSVEAVSSMSKNKQYLSLKAEEKIQVDNVKELKPEWNDVEVLDFCKKCSFEASTIQEGLANVFQDSRDGSESWEEVPTKKSKSKRKSPVGDRPRDRGDRESKSRSRPQSSSNPTGNQNTQSASADAPSSSNGDHSRTRGSRGRGGSRGAGRGGGRGGRGGRTSLEAQPKPENTSANQADAEEAQPAAPVHQPVVPPPFTGTSYAAAVGSQSRKQVEEQIRQQQLAQRAEQEAREAEARAREEAIRREQEQREAAEREQQRIIEQQRRDQELREQRERAEREQRELLERQEQEQAAAAQLAAVQAAQAQAQAQLQQAVQNLHLNPSDHPTPQQPIGSRGFRSSQPATPTNQTQVSSPRPSSQHSQPAAQPQEEVRKTQEPIGSRHTQHRPPIGSSAPNINRTLQWRRKSGKDEGTADVALGVVAQQPIASFPNQAPADLAQPAQEAQSSVLALYSHDDVPVTLPKHLKDQTAQYESPPIQFGNIDAPPRARPVVQPQSAFTPPHSQETAPAVPRSPVRFAAHQPTAQLQPLPEPQAAPAPPKPSVPPTQINQQLNPLNQLNPQQQLPPQDAITVNAVPLPDNSIQQSQFFGIPSQQPVSHPQARVPPSNPNVHVPAPVDVGIVPPPMQPVYDPNMDSQQVGYPAAAYSYQGYPMYPEMYYEFQQQQQPQFRSNERKPPAPGRGGPNVSGNRAYRHQGQTSGFVQGDDNSVSNPSQAVPAQSAMPNSALLSGQGQNANGPQGPLPGRGGPKVSSRGAPYLGNTSNPNNPNTSVPKSTSGSFKPNQSSGYQKPSQPYNNKKSFSSQGQPYPKKSPPFAQPPQPAFPQPPTSNYMPAPFNNYYGYPYGYPVPPGFSRPPYNYNYYPAAGFPPGADQSPTNFDESAVYDYSKGYDPSLANASDYQANWGAQGQLAGMGDESFAQNPQQPTSPTPDQGGAKQSVGSLDELRNSAQPMPGGNGNSRGPNRFLQQQQQQQQQQQHQQPQQVPQMYGTPSYPMSNTQQAQYNSFPQQGPYQTQGFQGQQNYNPDQQYGNQWGTSS